eukprot:6185680-Pleurochrysis_carterae.AAC.1
MGKRGWRVGRDARWRSKPCCASIETAMHETRGIERGHHAENLWGSAKGHGPQDVQTGDAGERDTDALPVGARKRHDVEVFAEATFGCG